MGEVQHKILDPSHAVTPTQKGNSGGKHVNRIPIVIGSILVLLVLATVVKEGINRGTGQTSQSQDSENQTAHGQAALNFANSFTASFPNGILGRDTKTTADVPKTPSDPPKTSSNSTETERKHDQHLFDSSNQETFDPLFEERLRIRERKHRAFEAALSSQTRVASFQRAEGSAQSIQAKLVSTRQRLAEMGDPSALYQAKLAQLSGDDLDQPASGDRLEPFKRDGNWELPSRVEAPASPFLVRAGAVLPAVMISGISSDLPGQVMAQVSQPIYDTATGKHLLLPQGTRLIGTYASDVAFGQQRVLMAWQRLVFPNGHVLDIGSMPGADIGGYAGFHDRVDNHYLRTFGSAFLLSGIIAAVSMSQQDGNTDNGNRQRANDALSESLGQTLGQTMSEMLRKNMNVSPTLQIRPGYRFNVMATKDMTFQAPYHP